jgi:hypothetical protein
LLVREVKRIIPAERQSTFQRELDKATVTGVEDQPDPPVTPLTCPSVADGPFQNAGDWQPMPRVFHQEVLDKLMQRIQEKTGQLTSELNAVELLDGILSKQEQQIPDGIKEMRDLGKTVGSKLIEVSELIRDYRFEAMEETLSETRDRLDEIHTTLDTLATGAGKLWSSLRSFDDFPACVESFEKALRGLSERTDGASIQVKVDFSFSAEIWGISHLFSDDNSRADVADRLNDATAKVCEYALMMALKSGRGFGSPVREFIYQGLKLFFDPLVPPASLSSVPDLRERAARIAFDYFGLQWSASHGNKVA